MHEQLARIDGAIPKLREACDREAKIMAEESAAGRVGSETWQNARCNLDGNMQHIAALRRVCATLCS